MAVTDLSRTNHALPACLPLVIKLLALEKDVISLGFSKVFSRVLCNIRVAK